MKKIFIAALFLGTGIMHILYQRDKPTQPVHRLL
jgi:hypothetical protein